MNEHPPVPCPDCTKPLVFDYDHYKCSGCRCDFTHPWSLTPGQMATLWRLWTRGMAVVPLPEPDGTDEDGHPVWSLPGEHGVDELLAIAGDLGPPFVLVSSTCEMLQASPARRRGAAYLAAADRAEQLAAEANAEAVNQP